MIEAAQRAKGDLATPSLEGLVRGLARAIQTRRAKQPFFIELAGTPRAGKTTVLLALEQLLRSCQVDVKTVDESANSCPIPEKCDPDFNLWTFSTTLAQILAARHSGSKVVLIDRGIVDAACWMDCYRHTGCLQAEEYRVIEDYVLLKRWTKAMNLVLVMKTDPAEAMKRDGAGNTGWRSGQIVNARALGHFNTAVDRTYNRFKGELPLVPLDTTCLNPAEVLYRLVDAALARC